MNTNLTTGHLIPEKDFREIKAREMAEMQEIMDGINNSDDPKLRYQNQRPVTDIKQMLKSSAELYGERPLFWQKFSNDEPFRAITYSRAYNDVNALGTALIEMGLKGKHIGIIGKNCYQWAESYYTVIGGVGIVVPLDKELSESELKQLTQSGELTAVIADEKHYGIFKDIMDEGETDLTCVIGMELEEDEKKGRGKNRKGAVLSWTKLRAEGYELVENGNRDYIDAQIVNTDMAEILFTSGTTGIAKGVMLSNRNLCTDIMISQAQLEVLPADIFFSVLPIHHSYECTSTLLEGTYCGASMAYCRGLKYITKDLEEVRPTMLLAVPAIYDNFYSKIIRNVRKQGKEKMLMNLLKVNRVTQKVGLNIAKSATKQITDIFGGRMKILITGGAAIDIKIMDFFNDMGIKAVQGYGLTECSPMVALNPDVRKDMRNKSCGYVFHYIDTKIVDKDSDGNGEICFRGPNVMMGYYKNPEATAEVMDDEGFFHTGDVGYMEDGYVYITGRKKNVIITANGKNVFPEELEFYILKHDLIEECMVWGNETGDNGDVNDRSICATVRVSQEEAEKELGKEYTDEQLQALVEGVIDEVNEDLPLFKKIKHVVVRKRDFNKTTGLKIRRFVSDNRNA